MANFKAEPEQTAQLDLLQPDILSRNISAFATALRKLEDFAAKEERSIPDLVAEVELATTWTRFCEGDSQRACDLHDIEEYIESFEARREEDTGIAHQSLGQVKKVKDLDEVKEAQRRILQDTHNLEELFAAVDEHRQAVGWAIYNKYGTMRELLAQYEVLSEKVLAAETRVVHTIDEINEMIGEFMDMVPSRKEAFELNDKNDAIMEPLIAELDRLVGERDALAQRMYDYEVARRRFLHQTPLPPRESGGAKREGARVSSES